jgi:6-phosphofructokinase 1
VQFIEQWNSNLRQVDEDMELANMYKKTEELLRDLKSSSLPASAVVIGILGARIEFTSIEDLFENEADIELRKGRSVHWGEMAKAGDMLSGRSLLRNRNKH